MEPSGEKEPSSFGSLLVSSVEISRGTGYTNAGFIRREYGEPLQQRKIDVLASNAQKIASALGLNLISLTKKSQTDIDRLFGDYKSEVVLSGQKRLSTTFPFAQGAFLVGQAVNSEGKRTVCFRDERARDEFSSLFPENRFSLKVNGQLGEGGRFQYGHNLVFYTTTDGNALPEDRLEEIFGHSRTFFLRSPAALGIEDPTKSIKNHHLDQLVGPDIFIEGEDSYIIVPIQRGYYEKLNQGAKRYLPEKVVVDEKAVPVYYLPIEDRLLQMFELLNAPCIKGKVFIGPVLARVIKEFIQARNEGKDPFLAISQFQQNLTAQIPSIPATPFWQELQTDRSETRSDKEGAVIIYQIAKFLESFDKNRELYTTESLDGLSNIEVLPEEVPAIPIYKAGLKCGINFVP
jgi:hypothetical protein